jgi:glycosyltransferase involved in cell wall biosynthesis
MKKNDSSSHNKQKILLVIPAYNEEANIAKVVASVPNTVTVSNEKYAIDIVIVDDCSDDKTYDQAKKTRARVLRHIMNLGAGAATRTGFAFALKNLENLAYVITIDADGQHNVDDIKRLVEAAVKANADMVVGNRLHAGNSSTMPFHRRFGNWGLSVISRVLFGIKVQDTQSGLRLIKASALKPLAGYTIDRYGFCTEVLWIASRSGMNIVETPIDVIYSEETLGKGQNNWGVINLVIDLILVRIARSM